jgi:hypothetical protein
LSGPRESVYTPGVSHNESILFNQALASRDDDAEYARISVSEPQQDVLKKAVFYKILAFDIDGEFECKRRYSDF